MIRCNCCQAEITAPVWINGYPYGFVCAGKITGSKHKKPKVKWDEYTGEYITLIDGKIIMDINGNRKKFSIISTKTKGNNGPILPDEYSNKIITIYTKALI